MSDKIKDALDKFEDEQYTDAKEIIKKEFIKQRNKTLKDKLGLEKDIDPEPEEEKEKEEQEN
jgi:hypothetical protein